MNSRDAKKIILMGGHGLLGSHLFVELTSRGYLVIRQGRSSNADFTADPFDTASLTEMLDKVHPDLVVNLNAKTDVDDCERDIEGAFKGNVLTAKLLSECAASFGSKLVHISTDQVYSGSGFQCEDSAAPINSYSLSKYAGELAALCNGATVIRTNFICGSASGNGKGLANWLYRSIKDDIKINVFEDVYFNPVHPKNIANILARLMDRNESGLFNFGAKDGLSKAQLAHSFCRRIGSSGNGLTASSVKNFEFSALRPLDMRMDVSRISAILEPEVPSLQEVIDLTFSDFSN